MSTSTSSPNAVRRSLRFVYRHVQEGKERKAVDEVQGKLAYLSRKAS